MYPLPQPRLETGQAESNTILRRTQSEELSNNILLSIINFSLETIRHPDYLDGRLKASSKKREPADTRSPLKVSRKKTEKKNPFLDLTGVDMERRRRSLELYRLTQDECYACDAETQTKKKKKSQCRIC